MGLDDEDADTTDQEARDRDTQKKKANKDYVDKKFHARERDVRGETGFCWNRREKTSYPRRMRRSHMR